MYEPSSACAVNEAKEGFSWLGDIPHFGRGFSGSFRKVAAAFFASEALPFAHVLSADRIERVFAKHGGLFGKQAIYSTAMMVWSFLGQVLRDGKEASCQAAVARVVSYCEHEQIAPPTADTGDYCRARAKLSEAALHELSCEVAAETEEAAEADWLWKDKHAKLIDGFTFTMPDTADNQAEYPQPKSQKPGVGLPIARVVAILSLATACVMDVALGPYAGKQTGEPALLRELFGRLGTDDIAVTDRYYCSFMMIALLLAQGTHVCARKHQRRHSDFRRGRRLGKYDHLIIWTRPARPEWMDEATYETIPETLELREIRYTVVEPGQRTRSIDVITTLTDAEEYTREDIAQLYGFRWNAELDIRIYQVQPESRARALQVAGDGPLRTLDDSAGLQSDPHDGGRGSAAARQTAAADQLHRDVPVRAGVVDVAFLRADTRLATGRSLPHDAPPDRRLRGRQPPRPTRTKGSQTTQTWL